MNWHSYGRSVAAVTIALSLVAFGGARTTAEAAAPAQIVWNGVQLGEAVSTLRDALGDPIRIIPDPTEPEARYWIPGSDSTFFLVLEKDGYVRGIHAFVEATPTAPVANVPPDPSGVQLGDTMQTVKQLHPNFTLGKGDQGEPVIFGAGPLRDSVVVYDFDHGRVHSFDWQMKLPANLPTLPPISEPDGTSVANAILDVQANESAGMHWEDLFISFQPCDTQALWQQTGQGIDWVQGHPYDVNHVVCPTTKVKRDFYFDIGNFFGKD
jgi:hypothetical protein